MTIKQALKLKNKLVKEITEAMVKVQTYNSVEVGNTKPYSSKESLDEVTNLTNQLVELKTKIHQANLPVYGKIFRMSELKSLVSKLKSIDCTEGKTNESRRYGESATIIKTTVFDQVEMDNLITYYEGEIEKIQEELDVHNASTHI